MKLPKLRKQVALTRRENDVIRCFVRGRLNKEIADELGVSFSAVHKHQHNIFRKLQVNNRSEGAFKWMLVKPQI